MVEIRAKKLKKFSDKSRGLIGESRAYNVYFETRFGIHTYFMKFPIDVIILDNGGNVKSIAHGLKPNKIWMWNPVFKRVIEMPSGEITRMKINLDSKVKITTF